MAGPSWAAVDACLSALRGPALPGFPGDCGSSMGASIPLGTMRFGTCARAPCAPLRSASRKCEVSKSESPMPLSCFLGGGGRAPAARGERGGFLKSASSSGIRAPGSQLTIPSFQTRVSGVMAPEASSTPSSTRVRGPVSCSAMRTYQVAGSGATDETVPPGPGRMEEG